MRIIAVILSVAVITAYHDSPANGQSATPTQRMTAVLDFAAATGFQGQVLAISNGKTFFEAARGPGIDSTTVFSIGSITKMFTKTAILKLEEEGRLATSDKISQYLSELPADKRDITIQQVMDMAAGFGAYHDDKGDHQRMDKAEALARISAQKLLFAPGTSREYSNSGYTLLAMIVEQASGMPYQQYLRTRLMQPAGMRTAGFFGDDIWRDAQVARGQSAQKVGDNAPHTWPPVSWALQGAGGIVASACDLAGWITALRAGRIIKLANVARVYMPGLDFALYAGGDNFGFLSSVFEADNGKEFLIVNSNTGDDAERLTLDLVRAWRGELPPRLAIAASKREAASVATAAQRFVDALKEGTAEAIKKLVQDHFSKDMREGFPIDEHVRILSKTAERMRDQDVSVTTTSPTRAEIRFADRTIELELDDDGRIAGIIIN